MSLFKCKMCGGALEINNETVVTCEYCGTQQTLPKLDDDRRANLYDRANHFRRNNEFDKAMGIYEQILNEDKTDAEAYWSLVLCRYGIEYVEDPSSHKRMPTVNRAQFTSIFDDDNYKSALQYADTLQKAVYEQEAKAINEIQKGILAISQKEEPFDVFICYKETDANGRRTPDSVLANDLYHQLTQEGFKVFFSRITLEDKLGSAYEPYIFAALNSAKVMVVLGTKAEYFNAVWVKNEWSRYLALIKNGAKKMLIPAYKDVDPYELPDEFSHLQAQDMSKLGFMQDLIRGIKKITQVDEPKQTTVVNETIVTNTSTNTAPLLKRAFMFLEDGEWDRADDFCEQVLNIDPECTQAYLGKLMAELRVKKQGELKNQAKPFDNRNNYQKAVRFADDNAKKELQGYIDFINNRNLSNAYNHAEALMNSAKKEDEFLKAAGQFVSLGDFKDSKQLVQRCRDSAEQARLLNLYNKACESMNSANTENEFKTVSNKFAAIKNFKDSEAKMKQCLEKAEEVRKDTTYSQAQKNFNHACNFVSGSASIESYQKAKKIFQSIPGWKDADDLVLLCDKKIEEVNAKIEADRLKRERNEEIARKEAEENAKKTKKRTIITVIILLAIIAFVVILTTVIIPSSKYNKAVSLMNDENYEDALEIFTDLGGFKDSREKHDEVFANLKTQYRVKAEEYLSNGDNIQAAINYIKSGDSVSAKRTYDFSKKVATSWAASAAIASDGTLYYVSERDTIGNNDKLELLNISSISVIDEYDGIVGLNSSGNAVFEESYYMHFDNEKVGSWSGIKQLEVGSFQAFALFEDGTVKGAYDEDSDSDYYYHVNCSMTDIVEIGINRYDLWAIDSTGKLYYSPCQKKEKGSKFDLSQFSSVKKIAFFNDWLVGVTTGGDLVYSLDKNAENAPTFPLKNIKNATDVVATDCGIFVLLEDGTVVSKIYYRYWDEDYNTASFKKEISSYISSWKNIVYLQETEYGIMGVDIFGNAFWQSTDYDTRTNNEVQYVYVESHSEIKTLIEETKNITYVSSYYWTYSYSESRNVIILCEDGSLRSLDTGEYLTLEESDSYSKDYYAKRHYDGSYDKVSDWKLW